MATTIQQIELPKKARAVDTSGNNNHGQIYSGRALEFDGIADHLNLGSNITVSTGAWTLACWVNIVSTPTNVAFSVNSNSVGGNTSAYIGIFASSLKLAVYDWGNTAWKESNTPLKLNTWCRIIFSYDGSGTLTFYQNGIADGEVTLGASGNDAHFFARYIGSMSNETRHFDGKMANWQAWDAAFTQADVTYDYLNPESLALNNSGTALTESNLKLWYPMQDGHRGQQSYILDGANTGLGVELVTNGDFATGSNWSFYNSSLVGEAVRINNVGLSGINAYIIQHSILEAGRLYKFECDVISTNGKDLFLENSIPANISVGATTVGHKSIYFTQGAGTQLTLKRLVAETDVTVDNVSIKAINDKHHATTVFYGDELIPHTNDRTFAGASNWANAAGDNAFANYDETGSGQLTVTPDDVSDVQYAFLDGAIGDDWEADMVAGRTYRLTYDIHVSAFTKGTLSVGLSTDAVPAVMKAKTDYTATNGTGATATLDFVYVAADHEMITIYAAANTVLTADFDNFSLKEVGVATGWTDADQQLHIPQTALQSYNELAWFDGEADYVTIADHDDLSFDAFSVSAWINMNDATHFPVISKGAYNSTAEWLFITEGTDKLNLYLADESEDDCLIGRATAALTSKEGEWLHVVGTYDGGTASSGVKLYINGVQSDNSNAESNPGSFVAMENLGAAVRVGRYNDHYANGAITETSLWNKELSSTEVLELFNDGKALDALTHSATANIKGYWRNNGLSTWTDLKGSNDGTPTSVTETILIPQGVDSTRDAQGFIMNKQKSTSCLNLDGIGYAEMAADSSLTDITNGTIQFWFKNTNTVKFVLFSESGATNYIGARNPAAANGLWYNDAASGTVTSTADNNITLTAAMINDGDWHMHTMTGVDLSNFDIFQISNYGADWPVKATIDGLKVYDRVLTGPEIIRNYNATKGNHRN
jgi:hypothetical protein